MLSSPHAMRGWTRSLCPASWGSETTGKAGRLWPRWPTGYATFDVRIRAIVGPCDSEIDREQSVKRYIGIRSRTSRPYIRTPLRARTLAAIASGDRPIMAANR